MIRLRNTTNISDDTLRKLIRAVVPPNCGRFDVEVRNSSRSYAGAAYTGGSSYHATRHPFIVLRLPRDERFREYQRHSTRPGQGYLPVTVGSRIEATLAVAAHELRHLWQRHHTRGRVWGSRGRYSERDATAYEIGVIRKFRRGELDFTPADWVLKTQVLQPAPETIERATACPPPPVDRAKQRALARAFKLAHAETKLALACTRLKRATTLHKKWERRVKRLRAMVKST